MDLIYSLVFKNYNLYKIIIFLGNIFNFLYIIFSILIIIVITIDLVKMIINPNNNKISNIIKKIVFALSIFFIPIIVKFIYNTITNDYNDYLTCFLNPTICSEKIFIEENSYTLSSEFASKEECEKSGRKWIYLYSDIIGCHEKGCYACVEKSS